MTKPERNLCGLLVGVSATGGSLATLPSTGAGGRERKRKDGRCKGRRTGHLER
ncbi:hypothetical protein G9409_08285 [Chlorobium sp. BLA1]|uniref:hypothetical protein n=1 Tax=Candidatus Chlorobium masyuteum TaxID=2716876 RepID=UPI001420ABD4|nr:hypothetical protein [Candidatus Chlorobium masyuteum]NHQ60584.1 hypothetical protein [Candidatus Chlorobium masyuteum]